MSSILNEVKQLSDQGVKEIVLLGQNVNSYHDKSEESKVNYPDFDYSSTPGFKNMYKLRDGAGARFADLLSEVAAINPEIRIRFTSPHPKVPLVPQHHRNRLSEYLHDIRDCQLIEFFGWQ